MWLSGEELKEHPRLVISADEGDLELLDLELHRSQFSGPDLSFRVNVYP